MAWVGESGLGTPLPLVLAGSVVGSARGRGAGAAVASKSAGVHSGEWPWPEAASAVVISASDMTCLSLIISRSLPPGQDRVPAGPGRAPKPAGDQPVSRVSSQ